MEKLLTVVTTGQEKHESWDTIIANSDNIILSPFPKQYAILFIKMYNH